MSGYIGSKSSVTLVDGYTQTEADAEFVAKAGDTMTGDLSFGDNDKAIFGAGSDLQIYHDGSHSRIDEQGTGVLFLQTNGTNIQLNKGTSENMLVANVDGSVDLYYDNSAKLATTSTGIDVTGTVTATTLQTTAGGTVTTASGNDLNIVYPAGRSLFIKEGSETHVSVDNAGNVGIGKSPATRLNVEGDWVSNTGQLCVDGASGQTYSGMSIRNNGTLESLWYHDNSLNTVNLLTHSDPLVFWTANVKRMRITAAGGIQIGTDSAIASGDAAQWNMMNGSTGVFHRFLWAGATLGSITINGSAVAYNTSSDYRLKTDAQPMIGASARVQALNPVNFEWIASGDRVDGFLAHEAQAVVPESVTGTKDAMMEEEYEVTPAVLDDDGNETTPAVMGTRSVPAMQGIDQSKMVPLLTAALQEALNKIDTMETRLAALEGN